MADNTGGGVSGDVFAPAGASGTNWFVWTLALLAFIGGLMPGFLGVYYGTVQRNVQFTVDAEGLDVTYKVGRITIAAEDIAAVEYVPRPDSMRRISGAGMGNFQMGWYRLADFGRVYRLTTGPGSVVFIDVAEDIGPGTTAKAGVRYVFAPEEGEEFAASLETLRRGGGFAQPITFASRGGKPISPWPWILLGLILAVPGGVVPVVIARGRRGLRYEVGREGIIVHHLGRRLYPWKDIVEVTVREEPIPGLFRLMGAALPGYYAGSFRSRPYKNLQLNGTRLTPPLVVVETKRLHLVVTPEDVDGFVKAVARHRPKV